MSRTKRKDPIDHRDARVTSIILFDGKPLDLTPTKKEKRRAHQDRKKHFKPGRAAKVSLHKGQKAKLKAVVKKIELGADPDGIIVKEMPKTDVWRYN